MPVSRGQPDESSPPASQALGLPQDGDQMEWETYAWEPEGELPASAPKGVGIRALARRLMARERAAARRSAPARLAERLRPRRSAAQRQRPQDGSPDLFVGDE